MYVKSNINDAKVWEQSCPNNLQMYHLQMPTDSNSPKKLGMKHSFLNVIASVYLNFDIIWWRFLAQNHPVRTIKYVTYT